MTKYLLQTTIGNISGQYIQELNLHYGVHATTDKKEKAITVTEEEGKVLSKFFPELVAVPKEDTFYLEHDNTSKYIGMSYAKGALSFNWVRLLIDAHRFNSFNEACAFRELLVNVGFSDCNRICIEKD